MSTPAVLERARADPAVTPRAIVYISPDEPLVIGGVLIRRALKQMRPMLPVWVGFVVACGLLTVSFWNARLDPQGKMHYHLFWLAVVAFLLPAGRKMMSPTTRSSDRVMTILALGLLSYVPKILFNPGGPIYFDELAHYVQTERLYSDGHLFTYNGLVHIVEDYPGLHTLTVSLRHITGLSTWTTSLVLIFVLHLTMLLGVYSLAKVVTGSSHTAGIAAFLAGVAPGLWFFNSQFAYESLAIVLFMWAIVCFVTMTKAPVGSRRRTGFMITGLVCAGGMGVTHHLTSYMLIAQLAFMTGIMAWRWIRRKEKFVNLRDTAFVFVVVVTVVGWWLFKQAPKTASYLGPYIKKGTTELGNMLTGKGGAAVTKSGPPAPKRKLFAGSTIPIYEQLSAFVTPPGIGFFGFLGWLKARKAYGKSAGLGAVVVMAGIYVAVFPMFLSATGNEGARRSWAFTYFFVGVLIACWMAQRNQSGKWPRRVWGTLLGPAAIVLLIGNIASDLPADYRFPGGYVHGADTRAVTPEAADLARWFRDTLGANRRVIADRSGSMVLDAFARALSSAPSEALPVWDVLLKAELPSADTMAPFEAGGFRMMLVDKRNTKYLPRITYYIDQQEPGRYGRVDPLPIETVTKWADVPWAIRIYSSTSYDLYRLDYDQFHAMESGTHS